jgi:hypothetical protein
MVEWSFIVIPVDGTFEETRIRTTARLVLVRKGFRLRTKVKKRPPEIDEVVNINLW